MNSPRNTEHNEKSSQYRVIKSIDSPWHTSSPSPIFTRVAFILSGRVQQSRKPRPSPFTLLGIPYSSKKLQGFHYTTGNVHQTMSIKFIKVSKTHVTMSTLRNVGPCSYRVLGCKTLLRGICVFYMFDRKLGDDFSVDIPAITSRSPT